MDSKTVTDALFEGFEHGATRIMMKITSLEDDSPDIPTLYMKFSEFRFLQFKISKDWEYLEEAICPIREVVQTAPSDSLVTKEAFTFLANLLSMKYAFTKVKELQQSHLLGRRAYLQTSEELSEHIEQLSTALTTLPNDNEDLPMFQYFLAQMYFSHALRTTGGQSLGLAAKLAKKALRSTVESDNNRPSFEKTYQKISMYQNIGRGMSISDAMKLSQKQAGIITRDVPDSYISTFDDLKSLDHYEEKRKTVRSIKRGFELLIEYCSERDSVVIDRAINTFRNSIIHDDLSDNIRRAWRLLGLARCLKRRYEFEGREEDLHEALDFAEKGKVLAPADDFARKRILRDLANIQQSLYTRTGQTEYHDKAIENHREALRLAQNEDSDETEFAHSLGLALLDQYRLLNKLEDREAAEEMIQQAFTLASGNSERQGCIMIDHAILLYICYEDTDNLDYLELAIKKRIEGKNLLPEGHYVLPKICYIIGNGYFARFLRLNRDEDLREAITFTRQAIETAPKNSIDRGYMVVSLITQLEELYDLAENIEELEKGIWLIREIISSLPPRHTSLLDMRRNLALLLWKRMDGESYLHKSFTSLDLSLSTSGLDDLNEAIECLEQALKAYAKTHRNNGPSSIFLGMLLSTRAAVNQDSADIERAQDLFLGGVENAATRPLSRIATAIVAIRPSPIFNQDFTQWKDRVAKIALDVLPYACSRELSREDQQQATELAHGFAADICSLSIQLGNIEEALRRVEYGRGLILGHLIDRKDDLAGLREKHPDFARRYQELRHRAFLQSKMERLSDVWESMMEDRRKAHSMMRECEKQIRRNPGFGNFQQPPSVEELQKSAEDGPIIIVNVSNISSDAIILTTSHLESIPLPSMTRDVPEIFERMLGRYRSGINIFLDPRRNVEKEVCEPHSTQLLTWLWCSCVFPVLARLQELGTLPETPGDPPRVWWIGSGAANSLPFHAAGDFDEICRLKRDPEQDLGALRLTCMDWVTPSYAPTIKALQYARARADKLNLADKPSFLVVAMPETPGQSDLTGVVEEKIAVQESATGFCVESPLDYPSAEKVLKRLQGSSVVHFACHGMSDSVNPDASHILLQRRDSTGKVVPDQLTVGAILDATIQSGSGPWLVYLSACSTAQVKAKRMGDENIHLASAFQVAGFAHAIGSLWSAEDSICVEIARHFYAELSKHSGEERKFAVAYALRKAVMSVRSQHYHDPALWAPFIHFGA